MKHIYSFLFLSAILNQNVQAQLLNIDSVKNILKIAKDDSSRYQAYAGLSDYYFGKNNDSAFYFIEKRLETAIHANKKISEALSLSLKAALFMQMERYAESYTSYLESLSIVENSSGKSYWEPDEQLTPEQYIIYIKASIHNDLAMMLGFVKNDREQLYHFKQAEKLFQQIGRIKPIHFINIMYSRIYLEKDRLDSAWYFGKIAEAQFLQDDNKFLLCLAFYTLGSICHLKNEPASSKNYFQSGVYNSKVTSNKRTLVANYYGLCTLFLEEKQKDSALYYARTMYQEIKPLGILALFHLSIGTAYEMLGKAHLLNGNKDSALICQALALNINDSLFNIERKSLAEFRHLNLKENLRIQELEQEKTVYQNRVRTTFLIGGLLVLLIISTLLFHNSMQQRKAKAQIESAYKELKNTQAQLIQSEKMASLGELTAGIAHEIQNPLNFVNNFSEVSNELIDEMNTELDKGDIPEAKAIATDVKQNLEKILHHGKRADTIVKGMLQHSRSSTGVKESTDINALVDEYLRLSYHGLRTKDKSFNAIMKTDFDDSIGNINIMPQDMGRVFLNLYNNAFYAVSEKKKQAGDDYEPTVIVSTKKINGKVEIKVKDNGNGIPQKVLDKIFQPFFTTKPTGQGTGLGLSLSYDIVKAHGGEIKVNTKENEGTEFIIQLAV